MSLIKPKIFPRIFARILDYCFFYSLIILPFLSDRILPHDSLHILVMYLVPLLFLPLEAFFIHITKTTPGKALFGIKIESKNKQALALKNSFHRAFLVWSKGLCFGLFPLTLLTTYKELNLLKTKGFTSYDNKLEVVVYEKRKRRIQLIISSTIIFLYGLFFISEYQMRDVIYSDPSTFTTKIYHKDKEKWKTFNDPEGCFNIDFPSTPEAENSVLPTSSGKDPLPFSEIKFNSEDIQYNLSYTVLPKSITKWGSNLVLKGSLKLLSKHLPGGAKIFKKTSTSFKKYPAIDYILVKQKNKESMGRLVLIKDKLYKIEVTYPQEKKEQVVESTSIFLESFDPKN